MRTAALTSLSDIVRQPHHLQTKFRALQEKRRLRNGMIADLRSNITRTRSHIETQSETELSVFTPILSNLIEQMALIDELEKASI